MNERYSWVDEPNDKGVYGADLAGRVADHLVNVGSIRYAHKEYCGMGLGYQNGKFVYAEVNDGSLEEDCPAASFTHREAFVTWLAAQSDETLSGREKDDGWYPNNQRITRERLENCLAEAGRPSEQEDD